MDGPATLPNLLPLLNFFSSPIAILFYILMFWGWMNRTALRELDNPAFARRVAWLIEDQFGTLYRNGVSGFLDWLAYNVIRDDEQLPKGLLERTDDDASDASHGDWIPIFPWTSKSYGFCLTLALIYPFVFIIIFWFFDTVGERGVRVLLPPMPGGVPGTAPLHPIVEGAPGLVFIGLVLFGFFIFKTAKIERKRALFYTVIAVTGSVVGYGSGVFAFADLFSGPVDNYGVIFGFVTIAFAGSVSFAGSVDVAGALVLAVVFAIAIAFTSAVVLAIAIVLTSAVGCLLFYRIAKIYRLIPLFFLLHWALFFGLSFFVLGFSAHELNINSSNLILLMFLVLLPLANVALDWLSLGVTRGLLYAICTKSHNGLRPFVWALLDVLIALFFLCAVTLTVTATLTTASLVASTPVFDLSWIFSGLCSDPSNTQYQWIYWMLGSTLFPTAVHFMIACVAAMLVWPKAWRRWLLDGIGHSRTRYQ